MTVSLYNNRPTIGLNGGLMINGCCCEAGSVCACGIGTANTALVTANFDSGSIPRGIPPFPNWVITGGISATLTKVAPDNCTFTGTVELNLNWPGSPNDGLLPLVPAFQGPVTVDISWTQNLAFIAGNQYHTYIGFTHPGIAGPTIEFFAGGLCGGPDGSFGQWYRNNLTGGAVFNLTPGFTSLIIGP